MNLPAPYDVTSFPLPSRASEPPPRLPFTGLIILLLLAVAVSWYWLSRPAEPKRASEPTVEIPVGVARDIVLRLENARQLNEGLIAEAGGIQVQSRRLGPFFRANGYSSNHQRTIDIDLRAGTVARAANESIDQINLALAQLNLEGMR